MSTFDFRLRFKLPESYRINSDAEELELLVTPYGQRICLKTGQAGTPIKEHARAVVQGGPFESEEAARRAAEQSKRTLLFWAIEKRAGIDFGDGRQRSVFTNEGLRMFEEQCGVPFRNDVHGIDVFESSVKSLILYFNCTPPIEDQLEPVKARRHVRPPTVMTQSEVQRVMAHMAGVHLLMAKILYGCGLRLMECVRLLVQDLDIDRNLLYVRDVKGGAWKKILPLFQARLTVC